MESTTSERFELKQGLKQIQTGLIFVLCASALTLMVMLAPLPFLSFQVTGWISLILDCIGVIYLIPALLRLTNTADGLEIKGLALMVLGAISIHPLTWLISQGAMAMHLQFDLTFFSFLSTLVDIAGYATLAYLLWRIDARTANPPVSQDKPQPLTLASLILPAALVITVVLSSLGWLQTRGLRSALYAGMYVVLMIVTRTLRTRLDSNVQQG